MSSIIEEDSAALDKAAGARDCVTIRGVTLPLDGLVQPERLLPASVSALKQAFAGAEPFAHLVVDGLFDARLLELVAEEFDLLEASRWRRSQDGLHEVTLRSLPSTRLGRAAELYFATLHSGWFVDFLQQVTGVDRLIADPALWNGGFHEARNGGRFRIHTDFNKHAHTGLDNEMVLITYLNRDWNAEWGGALELWRAKPRECVRRIEPAFGRTVLMRHSDVSFHGHPVPLAMPPGQVRRSVAAYFYSNRADQRGVAPHASRYMDSSVLRWMRIAGREVVPPVVWKAAKKLVRR
ncbi:2OG-Fe(II) oxygenase [Piscinibacter sp. XHJ-5]|uniref:2OG-Fe(II) oxygenase n=1 Tax=Piscinibacter sp. XHJ-5 TaxID=3037797 RepID=UPI00245290CA|nr:2OG-Fe(II) oxygenase [Piscinibacter sp. XHJ-5]